MRITHLSTSDLGGGAARAAFRLHQGLLKLGCESEILVQRKISTDPTVLAFSPPKDWATRIRRAVRGRYVSRYRRVLESLPRGASYMSEDRSEHAADVLRQLPGQDVLHLHWVAGMFDYQQFFRRIRPSLPVVWTLHDMNPFTGGCHYDNGCGRYLSKCGACPQLGSHHQNDLTAKCWERKKQALAKIPPELFHIVAPSRWLAGEAQKSALLRSYPVSVIPYGLDTGTFRPRDKADARRSLGVPPQAGVILFAADSGEERRKGLAELLAALSEFDESRNVQLLCLGRDIDSTAIRMPVKYLGYIRDDVELSNVYSAADVFVAPSLQDNFPNTILEALACGTPVIAFAVGGCTDQISEGETGLLVSPGDPRCLRDAIVGLLANAPLRERMSGNCRRAAVENYPLELQAKRYMQLYGSMLTA